MDRHTVHPPKTLSASGPKPHGPKVHNDDDTEIPIVVPLLGSPPERASLLLDADPLAGTRKVIDDAA